MKKKIDWDFLGVLGVCPLGFFGIVAIGYFVFWYYSMIFSLIGKLIDKI